jgi:YD repeat-containing protein
MNRTICKAVEQRRVLELRYHGYSRIVERHVTGRKKEATPGATEDAALGDNSCFIEKNAAGRR